MCVSVSARVVNTRWSYICFTTKCLCYESLLQAEPITVNETISETLRARGGIQIKALLASHSLSLHLHNYRYDTGQPCVSPFVCVSILHFRGHSMHKTSRFNYKMLVYKAEEQRKGNV